MFLLCARTAIMYVVLVAAMRILGKRQIAQLEPSEFVVTMLVAELATIPLQDSEKGIEGGLVPIVTVLVLELAVSAWSMKSIRMRKLLCGKPVILVENGKVLQENLKKTRITLDELTGRLREKDVLDLSVVQYAILETSGNLSVFPFSQEQPASAKDAAIQTKPHYLPLTVVSDGRVITDNLKKAGKNRPWLDKELKKRKSTPKDTWLMTVDDKGNVHHWPKKK